MRSRPPPTSPDDPDVAVAGAPARDSAWRTNLWLFLATVGSVLLTGVVTDSAPSLSREALVHGAQFTAALMTILVAHELGHYVAARIHKVEASLPYFLPLPILSPFGTMGAVIRMSGTIPTRRALLDIGASGPLAGLVFAIPMYVWGAAHSHYAVVDPATTVTLGDSLLVRLIDHFAAPPAHEGMELFLSPVAFGAWGGMFVTMINLLPVSQLDGGHVAYALFGPRQNKIAPFVHRAMLAFFFVSLASFVTRDVRAGLGLLRLGEHVGNSLFWLVWFEALAILGTLAARGLPGARSARSDAVLTIRTRAVALVGLIVVASIGRTHSSPLVWAAWFAGLGTLIVMEARWGVLRTSTLLDHPSTGDAPLDGVRRAIAIVTLVFFVLLFMPNPMSM
jgi:hypothetical protein